MVDSTDGADLTDADLEGGTSHDGRFGKRFDDEVSVSGILWITFALAVACALGMLITWGMRGFYAARADAAAPPPSPVAEANERRLPPGPLLQRDPEGELEAMRHEMAERLSGYGWVDEGAGVAYIPIDQAMDLLVESAAGAAAAGAAETDAESAVEESAE